MISTLIFDLDGTLLNTLDDLTDAGNRLCAARGWPQHTPQAFRHLVGNGIPKLVERLTPEALRTPEVLQAALADFRAAYEPHMKDKTAPYPGIPELLQALRAKGVRVAVYSNKADDFARSVCEEYFGPDAFALVRGQRPGVPLKPDAAGTLALLQELGVQPDECWYIGDSDVDVLTAHNAGMRCCGVTWGFRGREELVRTGADALADTPPGVLTACGLA